MTIINALYDDLTQACKRLEEALHEPDTQIVRDAVVQRFEFTFELAWKLMQKIAQENSLAIYGPTQSIRAAARLGLIDHPEQWIEFLKARNLTVHMYDKSYADKVYNSAKIFIPHVQELLNASKIYLHT